jgi:DegV family protein with EDD domain
MIALVTDSTCDLPRELAAALKIKIVPQYVIFGEESFRDGVDLDGETFYKRLENSPVMPRTSQPSASDFLVAYQQARQEFEADQVLCLTISSKLSGSYSSAMQAAQAADFKVRVLDSQFTSMALGFLMLKAATLRDEGVKLEEISRHLEARIKKIDVFFTLATLDFLHRGGRIGRAQHLIGSALQIKPILHLQNGMVTPQESVRTRSRAVRRMLDLLEERLATCPIKRIAVLHGRAAEEADQMAAEVQKTLAPQHFYRGIASATVGTHTGPGVLGIAFDSSGD